MAKQAVKLAFKTTKGIAMYPWLNKADYQFDSNGQFGQSAGVKRRREELMIMPVRLPKRLSGRKQPTQQCLSRRTRTPAR